MREQRSVVCGVEREWTVPWSASSPQPGGSVTVHGGSEMAVLSVDYRDEVAVVRLKRGVTNAINLELVEELAGALGKIEQDSEVRGIVLTGSNDKFFSIGLDLPELFPLARREFEAFYRAFNRVCLQLYTHPMPTVAALTGHAVAGGCILALCCDYRFVAEGRKLMGMNEIKLGVPVPYVADCVLRYVVGVRAAREMMDSGEFYPPETLLRMGMVDRVLPPDRVVEASIEKIRQVGSSPREAFAIIKRNRVEPIEAEVDARLEQKMSLFVERWYSDAARERLRAAMAKF
jgi:enoyl-CoA hydratase/carnithine racemase